MSLAAVPSPSTRDLRRLSRSRVLAAIRFQNLGGRTEIAAMTGLTEAAVSRITRELIDAGILVEEAAPAAQVRAAGRPPIKLSIVTGSVHVLAYEIAANAQSVCLMDITGARISRSRLDMLEEADPEAAIRRAADAGLALIKASRLSTDQVCGAGVSIAGPVDVDGGRVLNAPNIGWHDVQVVLPLTQRLGMPVRMESRASALLLAEHRLGVARKVRNVFLINIALGIGGAVLMDGRLVRGREHAAGQIGHMPMPGATGLCLCLRIGCLDTLASGRAILASLGRLSAGTDTPRHGESDAQALRAVALEAENGSREVRNALNEAGQHLGTALRWAVAALQPELVVLAGVPSRCDAYINGLRHTYADREAAPIAISTIDNESAAGELALDQFVYANGFDLG